MPSILLVTRNRLNLSWGQNREIQIKERGCSPHIRHRRRESAPCSTRAAVFKAGLRFMHSLPKPACNNACNRRKAFLAFTSEANSFLAPGYNKPSFDVTTHRQCDLNDPEVCRRLLRLLPVTSLPCKTCKLMPGMHLVSLLRDQVQ